MVDIEVLMVDDGPTDLTSEIAERIVRVARRMRLLRGRINRGVARPGRWASIDNVIVIADIICEASAGARRCWSGLEDEASA